MKLIGVDALSSVVADCFKVLKTCLGKVYFRSLYFPFETLGEGKVHKNIMKRVDRNPKPVFERRFECGPSVEKLLALHFKDHNLRVSLQRLVGTIQVLHRLTVCIESIKGFLE